MAQKKPDDIMAEYLLKGAKMLSKACPDCGSPLFEVKGERQCVVCQTRKEELRGAPPVSVPSIPPAPGGLGEELLLTLTTLCRRVREEEDPARCLALMEAVERGIEALQKLRHS